MKKLVTSLAVSIVFCSIFIFPPLIHAQTLDIPVDIIHRAKVTDITRDIVEHISDQEERRVQDITAAITKGDRKGEVVTFSTDFFYLKKGERFFLAESLARTTLM